MAHQWKQIHFVAENETRKFDALSIKQVLMKQAWHFWRKWIVLNKSSDRRADFFFFVFDTGNVFAISVLLWGGCVVFLGWVRRSWDGLVESCACRRCCRCTGPPPWPRTPPDMTWSCDWLHDGITWLRDGGPLRWRSALCCKSRQSPGWRVEKAILFRASPVVLMAPSDGWHGQIFFPFSRGWGSSFSLDPMNQTRTETQTKTKWKDIVASLKVITRVWVYNDIKPVLASFPLALVCREYCRVLLFCQWFVIHLDFGDF